MFLLPKTREDFQTTDYWDSFFKKRGKESFEWYGEYEELCGILHRYIKLHDQILIIGCGNSTVSASLYDLGYKDITNIDVSSVVIKQMHQKYGKSRPGLKFIKMDATNTSFTDASHSVIFDKGTLDALFPNHADGTTERINNLFDEIDRLLKVGGRYVCISLLQKHILNFILEYFTSKGWMIRICRCTDIEKNRSTSSSCLPVFAIICTKLKKLPNYIPIIEISMDENNVLRTDKDEVIKTINSIQEVELVCNGLKKSSLSKDEEDVVIHVTQPRDSTKRYTITIIESKVPVNVNKMKYAAFIVPLGKDEDWMFCSTEGRQLLLDNCKVDRLALIFLHKNNEYPGVEDIKNELADIVLKFAPKGVIDRNEKVIFLSMSVEPKSETSEARFEGESEFSGKFRVEDVIEKSNHLRRLIFLNQGRVIQSEVKMIKDENGIEKIDLNHVTNDYHIFLNVGVTLALQENKQKYDLLILGLGGGVLSTLISQCFQNIWITAVEIDKAIYNIAVEHFCLKTEDEKMKVEIEDGLEYLQESAKKGMTFDIIIYDLDNKDTKIGIACPPVAFLEIEILNKVIACLSDKGLFLLNLVCRSLKLKKEVYEKLRSVFAGVISVRMPEDVNEVVICWKKGSDIDLDKVKVAAKQFQECLVKNNLKFNNDIVEMSLMAVKI